MRQCPVASVDWSLRRLLCVLCLLQGVCAGRGVKGWGGGVKEYRGKGLVRPECNRPR